MNPKPYLRGDLLGRLHTQCLIAIKKGRKEGIATRGRKGGRKERGKDGKSERKEEREREVILFYL